MISADEVNVLALSTRSTIYSILIPISDRGAIPLMVFMKGALAISKGCKTKL